MRYTLHAYTYNVVRYMLFTLCLCGILVRPPPPAIRYTLYVIRYTLRYTLCIICYTLYVLRNTLYATRYTVCIVRYALYAIRCTLHELIHAIRYTLYAPRCMLYAIRYTYTLYVMRHMLYLIRHTLYATRDHGITLHAKMDFKNWVSEKGGFRGFPKTPGKGCFSEVYFQGGSGENTKCGALVQDFLGFQGKFHETPWKIGFQKGVSKAGFQGFCSGKKTVITVCDT